MPASLLGKANGRTEALSIIWRGEESPDEKHYGPRDFNICLAQTHVDVNCLMTVLGFHTVPGLGWALSR